MNEPLHLRDRRVAQGFSLDILSLATDVPASVLQRAEAGEGELSPEAKVAVCRALHINAKLARRIPELNRRAVMA